MEPAAVAVAAETSVGPPAGDAGTGSDPAVTAESAVQPACKQGEVHACACTSKETWNGKIGVSKV